MTEMENRDPVNEIVEKFDKLGYIADQSIGTAIHLAQVLQRPLLIEGRAGVGKTDIALTMSRVLETTFIRLQCYEGLDVASSIYEWNYSKQLLWIRMNENSGISTEEMERSIYSREFLFERPLLSAINKEKSPVLLLDEVDRADQEFEAFLLEMLAEFQVTIPEIGTIKAINKPFVVLTSNRTRELSDALRRRCIYLWIDYPDVEKELQIVRRKVDEISNDLARQICQFVSVLRDEGFEKVPGISETLDWAVAMIALNVDSLEPEIVERTMGVLIKDVDDLKSFQADTIERIIKSIA